MTDRLSSVLASIHIPSLDTTGWLPPRARRELREVARLRGELAAVQAQLTNVMRTETGRDTVAALGRATGMSNRDARTAEKAASSVAALPGAIDALRTGSVTADHLALMAGHANAPDAAALLALAAGQSVEEFATTVRAREIREAGPSWRDRQRAARSVRFFKAEFGCLGMRAVLPPIEGGYLQARLQALVDQEFRRAHPERARTLGGNGEEPHERRLADALIALTKGSVEAPEDGDASQNTGASHHGDTEHGDAPEDGDAPDHERHCNGECLDDDGRDRYQSAGHPPASEQRADRPRSQATDPVLSEADAADQARAKEPSGTPPGGSSDGRPNPTTPPVVNAPGQSPRRTASRRRTPTSRVQRARPGPGRIALVVCIEASTLEAELLGHGPISPTDVIDLTLDPRTDLYSLIRDCNGAVLRFGRTRRYATALQALAVAARDRHCTAPGCTDPPQRCDVHHEPPFEEGGRTDIDQMRLLCRGRSGHHPHRHERNRAGPDDSPW